MTELLPIGIIGFTTTSGLVVGEAFRDGLFECAQRLALANDGEVRIFLSDRVLLCMMSSDVGVLVASTTDGHATWNARRRATMLIRRRGRLIGPSLR